MKLLLNPVFLRMALGALLAIAAFGLGVFAIRRLRRGLLTESESLNRAHPLVEGLPVHTYHAVIQELKQQKHALSSQQQAERRKAKASDTLSATVLSSLSCGVLFFNTNGLVRQANPAARRLLGFASPVGMSAADLFRSASIRPEDAHAYAGCRVEEALSPALGGEVVIRGLGVDYATPDGEQRVFDLNVSPVLGDDASLLGSTCVLTDRTDIVRIQHDQEMHREVSAEMALGLRNSLTTIAGYAQQLARSRDPELARQLADDIATEASRLDQTIGGFLAGSKAAAAGS